jgi:hypothetical protein
MVIDRARVLRAGKAQHSRILVVRGEHQYK